MGSTYTRRWVTCQEVGGMCITGRMMACGEMGGSQGDDGEMGAMVGGRQERCKWHRLVKNFCFLEEILNLLRVVIIAIVADATQFL